MPIEKDIEKAFDQIRRESSVNDDVIYYMKQAALKQIKADKEASFCDHPFKQVTSTGTNHKCNKCNQEIK